MGDFRTRLNESIYSSGLTQDEISAKSGVSTKTIQNWTRNVSPTMPRLDQGVKVAMVLGVSAEYLVTGTENVYTGYSAMALNIARATDSLNDTGKREALHLVQSLEALHPFGKAGISTKTGV
jgi:transcriptional regulator with XRE-family HTH domain